MLKLVKIGAEGEGPCTDIMEIWDCPALVVLPRFAWSRLSSVSCQVTESKMESAPAYLAVHDTLAEASRRKIRLGLQ